MLTLFLPISSPIKVTSFIVIKENCNFIFLYSLEIRNFLKPTNEMLFFPLRIVFQILIGISFISWKGKVISMKGFTKI